MRLSPFIAREMAAILAHWEAFAAQQLPAAAHMTSLALRDHAQGILEAVALDLDTPQSEAEQRARSFGLAPVVSGAPKTAAQVHAVLRAHSGFDINQLVAEYLALRACVLRLWVDACRPQPPHVDDLIRFNEAIDRVLAESVCFFSEQVEKSRNLLLGTLGHDMRSPLQTIQMTALRLTALNAGGPVSAAAARLIRSGARIRQLLDDLVDFNRGELAAGMQIEASEIDLASLCAEELDQLRAAYPHHQLNLEAAGDTRGVWDGARMQRVLDNLVTNAVSYGAPGAPVKVAVSGEAADVRLDVTNTGPVIDAALLERIFEPLQRGAQRRKTGNFGLGLYVVREITRAHGGTVSGRSDASGTTFTVRLPRRDAAVAVHA